MKINDINLDNFNRSEYIAFINVLIDYYFVLFSEHLILEREENNE